MERHLELIEDQVLKHFGRAKVNTEVPLEPRWTEPVIGYYTLILSLHPVHCYLVNWSCVTGMIGTVVRFRGRNGGGKMLCRLECQGSDGRRRSGKSFVV